MYLCDVEVILKPLQGRNKRQLYVTMSSELILIITYVLSNGYFGNSFAILFQNLYKKHIWLPPQKKNKKNKPSILSSSCRLSKLPRLPGATHTSMSWMCVPGRAEASTLLDSRVFCYLTDVLAETWIPLFPTPELTPHEQELQSRRGYSTSQMSPSTAVTQEASFTHSSLL